MHNVERAYPEHSVETGQEPLCDQRECIHKEAERYGGIKIVVHGLDAAKHNLHAPVTSSSSSSRSKFGIYTD